MSARKLTKNLSIALIVVGVVSFLFALVSSIAAMAGIGVVSFIIGLVIYIRSKSIGQTQLRNIFGVVILVMGVALFSIGCTVKVPMTPDVGKIEIRETIPMEAGLLITEETKNYIFRGNPESFTASARPHEFPLGGALEKASVQTFSQLFQKVTIARTPLEAKDYKIVIEPKIEEFHFRYDQLSYAGFAVAVISKIKVRVTLASGETKIWEKSVESPEQKKGPWVINFSYEKDVGESASDALVFTLKEIAIEISKDAAVRRLAGEW